MTSLELSFEKKMYREFCHSGSGVENGFGGDEREGKESEEEKDHEGLNQAWFRKMKRRPWVPGIFRYQNLQGLITQHEKT